MNTTSGRVKIFGYATNGMVEQNIKIPSIKKESLDVYKRQVGYVAEPDL